MIRVVQVVQSLDQMREKIKVIEVNELVVKVKLRGCCLQNQKERINIKESMEGFWG